MQDTNDFNAKVQRFAEILESQVIAELRRQKLDCEANIANARVSVKPRRKFTCVDVGSSGRYMVENETGRIYGIKGYGRVHLGHYYGTLDTVDAWFWGAHRGYKPVTYTETCDACAREFVDESAELAAAMLEAHKEIAHREPEPIDPDAQRIAELESEGLTHSDACAVMDAERLRAGMSPEPYIPDEYADTSARVIQFQPRAERRVPRDWPPDEPTGTDGGGKDSAEPGGESPSEGESAQSAGASEPPAYTIGRARYAKNSVALRTSDGSGMKTRAARLAEALGARWSGREGAYIMSDGKRRLFERLYSEGWDACFFSRQLITPEGETLPEGASEFAPNARRWQIKCVCRACRRKRTVTPMYPTTKAGRDVMKTDYICDDCEPPRAA